MNDLTQREFLLELEELTEQVFAVTADLRRPKALGSNQRELLAQAFRCLHSIKGVASSAGFSAVAELAHQSESVLELVRAGRIKLDSVLVDTLEDVANTIAESLAEISSGKSERATDRLGLRLSAFAAVATGASSDLPLAGLPALLIDSLNEREKQLVLAALGRNANLFSITAEFAIAVFETQFQQLRAILTRHGEVISTLPAASGPAAEQIGFKIFYASELDAAELLSRLTAVVPQARVIELFNSSQPDPNLAQQADSTIGRSASAADLSPSFVRVELADLNRLRTSAHSIFEQLLGTVDRVFAASAAADLTECHELTAQLRHSLHELEEQIIALRTIPVGRVIQRAIRAGQVAARTAGKEVEFNVAGSDLRIDKAICDAVAAPLIHLIRNAVDHGIETPAERISAGKDPSGTVRIEAQIAGGVIRFSVADDGRGIDPAMISIAAATRGLIEQDAQLDMDQSLKLIFRPGFSTAPSVSSLSGRGVGLDVVEHSVTEIGGSVSVQSWPSKGSEFVLHLPPQKLQPL